jgi:hypothetical protein
VRAALALRVAELDPAGNRPWLRCQPEVLHCARIRNRQVASAVCRPEVGIVARSYGRLAGSGG